jgi:tetratricopeptide (TPR) repeat protein
MTILLKTADNFERQFKEEEALRVYKEILLTDGKQVNALIKATELSASVGERLINKNDKRIYFESAVAFANRAIGADSTNPDVYYVKALACSKMATIESENKKLFEWIREVKQYAEQALRLNANHAKANFIAGKWQFDISLMNSAKRMAAKSLYGGLPDASLENAISYLEKSSRIDPYYVLNAFTLAKAYKENNKPAQTMEALKRVVKLPTRTFDDAALKAEAQKMLQDLE